MDTATTEIYTLSLHDALPIFECLENYRRKWSDELHDYSGDPIHSEFSCRDRKSTRLNSSHSSISYAVFCLKKKKNTNNQITKHNHKKHPTPITNHSSTSCRRT